MHPLAHDESLEVQLSIQGLICLSQLSFVRLSTFGSADRIEEAAHAFNPFAALEILLKAWPIVRLRRLEGAAGIVRW